MADATRRPHVAVLVSPGLGHLIPTLELTKRLVVDHRCTATVFLATPEKSVLSTFESDLLHPSILPPTSLLKIIPLPATVSPLHGPSTTTTIVGQLFFMMRSILPHLLSVISQTAPPPTALIVDLFGTEALNIADSFGMRKYVFCTSNAWFLSQALYVPTLDKAIKPGEELRIPGCKPTRYEDIPLAVLEWGKPDYYDCVRMGSMMASADGILVNTWEDLDRHSIDALRTNEVFSKLIISSKTAIHPVGPLTRPPHDIDIKEKDDPNGLLGWLDDQPSASVVYISFGSGGTLSAQQTTELAYGLELSHQRFVWVIRPPLLESSDGVDQIDISRFVPEGFLERTRNLGKMVSMWANQTKILAHRAVGGFLTHCGWNSILESLTNGAPMIAWPLYAEQNMNAALLCEEMKVATRPAALPTKELITREEIAKMVRKIMVDEDGRQYRERAKELQWSAQQALVQGGSSANSLAQVVRDSELHTLGH